MRQIFKDVSAKLTGWLTGTKEYQRKTYLVDTEVLADVDHPSTKASSSTRLVADVVSIEVGVAQVVFLTLLHTLNRHIVLVKGQQGLQERIYITHHLLASIPAQILQALSNGLGIIGN